MTNNLNAAALESEERIERVGWGVLLIAVGTIWLLPDDVAPEGTWLLAVGLIVLASNLIRYLKRLRTSGFGVIVGLLALFAGLRALLDLNLPFIPIALIVIGAWTLLCRLIEAPCESPQATAPGSR